MNFRSPHTPPTRLSVKSTPRISATGDHFAQLLESSGAGYWTWHVPSGEARYSRSWLESLAYTPDEATPSISFWEERVHLQDLAQARRALRDHLEGMRESYECSLRLRTRSGAWLWVKETGKICRVDSDGNPELVIFTKHDNSSQHHTIHSLRKSLHAAQKTTESKTRFIANMSHDMRTALGSIIGFSELLLSSPQDYGQDQEHLKVITKSGKHLLALMNNVLDLSKIEAGEFEVEHQRFSIVDELATVSAMFQHEVELRRLSLTTHYEGPIPQFIYSDALRFRQILANIVGNAVKFTERGSVRIVVRTEPIKASSDNTLLIEVSDTGCGIAQRDQDHLFRPFSQANNETSKNYGGTGLGLSVSRDLARALGGDVELIRSVPGDGSVFLISFSIGSLSGTPLINTPPLENQSLAASFAQSEFPKSTELENSHILLVEDSQDIQALILNILERAGARVTVVADGMQAVSQVERNEFDVVLMDIQMPKLDGYEATRRIRKLKSELPVIALTAHAFEDDRERCMRAGFSYYLRKPVAANLLVRTICAQRHVNQSQKSRP